MADKFYVYDPENGFEEYYATAKLAKEAAEALLDAYRDGASSVVLRRVVQR